MPKYICSSCTYEHFAVNEPQICTVCSNTKFTTIQSDAVRSSSFSHQTSPLRTKRDFSALNESSEKQKNKNDKNTSEQKKLRRSGEHQFTCLDKSDDGRSCSSSSSELTFSKTPTPHLSPDREIKRAYAVCTGINQYGQKCQCIYTASQEEILGNAYSPVTTILENLFYKNKYRQYQEIIIYYNYEASSMCRGMYEFVTAYTQFSRENPVKFKMDNNLEYKPQGSVHVLEYDVSKHLKKQFNSSLSTTSPDVILSCTSKKAKTHTIHRLYMAAAYALADKRSHFGDSKALNGHKIGAILTDNSGKVLACGVNTVRDGWYTHHAEVNAVRNFLAMHQVNLNGHYHLFTTLQCCAMCAGMVDHIFGNHITVYYGQNDKGTHMHPHLQLEKAFDAATFQTETIKPLRMYELDNDRVRTYKNEQGKLKPEKSSQDCSFSAFNSAFEKAAASVYVRTRSITLFLNGASDYQHIDPKASTLFTNIEAGLEFKYRYYQDSEENARKKVLDHLRPLMERVGILLRLQAEELFSEENLPATPPATTSEQTPIEGVDLSALSDLVTEPQLPEIGNWSDDSQNPCSTVRAAFALRTSQSGLAAYRSNQRIDWEPQEEYKEEKVKEKRSNEEEED